MLTFHGHDKFRTKFGAFCTVFIAMIVIVYACLKTTKLASPLDGLSISSQIYYPELCSLYSGIQMRDPDGSLRQMEKAGSPLRPGKVFAFGFNSKTSTI